MSGQRVESSTVGGMIERTAFPVRWQRRFELTPSGVEASIGRN
jgi:hypothetical protein